MILVCELLILLQNMGMLVVETYKHDDARVQTAGPHVKQVHACEDIQISFH